MMRLSLSEIGAYGGVRFFASAKYGHDGAWPSINGQ